MPAQREVRLRYTLLFQHFHLFAKNNSDIFQALLTIDRFHRSLLLDHRIYWVYKIVIE